VCRVQRGRKRLLFWTALSASALILNVPVAVLGCWFVVARCVIVFLMNLHGEGSGGTLVIDLPSKAGLFPCLIACQFVLGVCQVDQAPCGGMVGFARMDTEPSI